MTVFEGDGSRPGAAWREVVIAAARLICECDGRRWDALAPWEQDRYARVAALVQDTILRMRGDPPEHRAVAVN